MASAAPGFRLQAQGAAPLFVESAAAAGLTFTHVNGATGEYAMPEIMGAGVALFDYDNDGDLDVYLVQGGAMPGTPFDVARQPSSRLFRNDLTISTDGRRTLKFTDVTDAAGVGARVYGMGAAVGDYDNDGDLDLFLTSFGPEILFRNNGDGTFTDATKEAGVSDDLWSTSAAFADVDRDGDLDLFVANYLDFTVADNKRCHDSLGARDYCSPRAYRPVPDRFYRNEGQGRFTNATDASGISRAYGAGLGVSTGDYNGDGWIDLYVANDANPNQLWINARDGTFRDEGLLSGAAVNAAGNPEGSMGIASGDVDADGDEDLFVTNIIGETFVLYENDGSATFDDARARWGLAAPTAAFTGFGTDWFDYDNDGWLDLFITNGAVNVIEAQRGQPAPFRMRNQLFRNTGSRRFVDTTAAAGAAFEQARIGRGAAFGDLDDDGDIDVVVTTNNGPVLLLLNQQSGAHWLQVRLSQEPANRFGVGARVGIERTGRPTLWRRVRTDGSYLSASDGRVHFGLGSSPALDAVVVEWPDGARERWRKVLADRLVTLRRGTGGK
ncbi:MAG TPA: CRTAC1 family protein [Vicinamibacterales bacterium]|nr:CRTAC1 family protein [Vicinamibacterales bacterium]